MTMETPRMHSHAFLDARHAQSESNVWAVIVLSAVMMVVEIVGGSMFGSVALVADGFHMSTHAGALFLAALAYTLARRNKDNPKFTFGPGKFGDLAGFSSALVLGVIAIGILGEAGQRLWRPAPIDFAQAIPVAALGLAVNLASAWLLSRGGGHHHGHSHGSEPDSPGGHGHDHGHGHAHGHEDAFPVRLDEDDYVLSVFEHRAPARFRLAPATKSPPAASLVFVDTVRDDGTRQTFAFIERDGILESTDTIPEPHEFDAWVRIGDARAHVRFAEPIEMSRSIAHDHNMRAAVMHVIGDAAVSVLVILGLTLARMLGWLWMDPLAGIVGALVIASWSWTLIRDTGRVLLDMNPDPALAARLRARLEREGDALLDLHVWRVGPGHVAAILSVETSSHRTTPDYRALANGVFEFAHLTIEIVRRDGGDASLHEPTRRVA